MWRPCVWPPEAQINTPNCTGGKLAVRHLLRDTFVCCCCLFSSTSLNVLVTQAGCSDSQRQTDWNAELTLWVRLRSLLRTCNTACSSMHALYTQAGMQMLKQSTAPL